MNKNNHAFTLIELLIVVFVVFVIMGLVFPVLSMVREKSKQAVCMSNMGQMYKALLQYTIENDGYLPLESNSGSCSGEVWFKAVDSDGVTQKDRLTWNMDCQAKRKEGFCR
jgi:type II secretory pathway pseudopilin PulG